MHDEPANAVDPGVIARAALETLVFAPIGLGAKLFEDAPAAMRRIRQELSNARFIGRLTVEQGASRLREQSDTAKAPIDAPSTLVRPDRARADSFPIEGYDEMPAIEIVAMLESLTNAQRAIVADHENAHRRRRTVLGKIDQLAP